jgi:hypothetical protein
MNAILPLLFLPAMLGQAEGALVTETPVVDRGEIRSGPVLTQSFELKHVDAKGWPIEIEKVEIGCGCGRYELSTRKIAYGETAKLTFHINTLALPEGPASWSATITYHDPPNKFLHTLTVRLKANILREISIDPPVLALTASGEFSQTITFADRRKTPTRIAKAISPNPHFTLDLREPVDAQGVRKQEIVWKVAPTLPAGLHQETLLFTTGDPDYPELRLPVKVTKRDADGIQTYPTSATIVIANGESEASTRVQLRAGGKDVSILSATSTTHGVSAEFSKGAAHLVIVRIIVNAALAGATGKAEVVVTLAEPKGKVIAIPVSW